LANVSRATGRNPIAVRMRFTMWNRWQPIGLINRHTPRERSLAECIVLSGICFDFPCRHSFLNRDTHTRIVFKCSYSVLSVPIYSHTTVSKVATLDEVTDFALVTQPPASLLELGRQGATGLPGTQGLVASERFRLGPVIPGRQTPTCPNLPLIAARATESIWTDDGTVIAANVSR
jgi:hypothetical protein